LKALDCRIHIGTATMPSILYNEIKQILGTDVLEVKLSDSELSQFNRHVIHKLESFEETDKIIQQSISENKKVLIVVNTIKESQAIYEKIKETYPDIPKLLLHSRFKRGDRNTKEKQLIGLNEEGKPTYEFNTSNEACIVVST